MARTETAHSEIAPGADKTKVFISYSRRDAAEFADELVAGLELAGFAPFLDRHDIAAGEDWEARLAGLIAQADTVVFVVSPEAVKSERCVWEVDKTLALSKRLLPVIYKPVPDADIPENLRRLQFVRFDTGRGVTRPLAELAAALRVDLEWIREHTRLGELAARWQARGQANSLLLRGDEVDAVNGWVANRKAEAPPISNLQRAFLDASKEADGFAKRRGRRLRRQVLGMWGVVGLLVIALIAGLAAWWYERWLKDQWYWFASVRAHVHSADIVRGLKPRQPFKDCTDCPEMIVVPAGTFTMGSLPVASSADNNAGPQREVAIASFAVSRFEVTFEEWDACATQGGCDTNIQDHWGRGRQPVVNVGWDDAKRYLAWLGRTTGQPYRLLSEAEWEYAARAGSTTAYSWGDEVGNGNANCRDCGSRWDDKQTAPVGSFAASAFGLHDMHGNVWEWLEDCLNWNYKGAPTDGTAWLSGTCTSRILRGGGWPTYALHIRSSHRMWDATGNRAAYVGFRVGRTLAP